MSQAAPSSPLVPPLAASSALRIAWVGVLGSIDRLATLVESSNGGAVPATPLEVWPMVDEDVVVNARAILSPTPSTTAGGLPRPSVGGDITTTVPSSTPPLCMLLTRSIEFRRLHFPEARIATLDLSGNYLGPANVPHLCRVLIEASPWLPFLETIDLSHNDLGPRGVAALVDLIVPVEESRVAVHQHRLMLDAARSLKRSVFKGRVNKAAAATTTSGGGTVDMSDSQQHQSSSGGGGEASGGGGGHLEPVRLLPAWKGLVLAWNELGDDGARELARLIPVQGFLTRLDAAYNNIGADGGRDIQESLKSSAMLRHVGLVGNETASAQYIVHRLVHETAA